ncbi:hypothetical protein [Zunongwangia sp. H14]|uniref:hypothetical protein n=1 Tax=Zunongwangia sp. H14 TaxID=3240792 RepID=UPI00356AB872
MEQDDNKYKDLLQAISFVALVIPILILIAKIVYTATDEDGIESIKFVEPLSKSAINDIRANWIVLIGILLHVIRIKLGIFFLQYDQTYLAAGKKVSSKIKKDIIRNRFIIANVIITFFLASSIGANFSEWLIVILLLLQAIIILWYDWYNKDQLFHRDSDKKSNFLILIGDIAFFGLVILTFIYYLVFDMDALTEDNLLISYYCLAAFSVLELITIIFFVEIFFTYKEGVETAYKNFIKILVEG